MISIYLLWSKLFKYATYLFLKTNSTGLCQVSVLINEMHMYLITLSIMSNAQSPQNTKLSELITSNLSYDI